MSSRLAMREPALPDLLVVCLCADWCGTCRTYRATFDALAGQYPDAAFHWVDIEDDAEWFGDLDVETFPTILIQRADTVLFFGPVLPQPVHLQRTLAALGALGDEEARSYAASDAQRRAWQQLGNVREALRQRARHGGA
jgi:thiol-disulfide isomerase/thioredoxin